MKEVPLSRYLARFSTPVPIAIMTPDGSPDEPQVTLSVAEFDARLQTIRTNALAEASATLERQLDEADAKHQTALNAALSAARSEWVIEEAERLHARFDAAFAELRSTLCDRLAAVLRPLLADMMIKRAVESFAVALDQLLSDPAKPIITVKGPPDLVAALQAARPAPGHVEFHVADDVELSLTAGDAYVETRLAAALTSLTTEASPHVG